MIKNVVILFHSFFQVITLFLTDIVKLVGGFLKDNIGNVKEIISQTKEFTDTIMGIFSKIDFSKCILVNNNG